MAISSKATKILMCRPTYFSIEYSINQWMNVNNQARTGEAMNQWNNLKDTIEKCGAEVLVMEPKDAHHFPDLVFTANAALVRGKTAYLANFRCKERKGEQQYYGNWFRMNGYFTVVNPSITHEGTGDALWTGKGFKTLFSAVGPRSDENACADIQKSLSSDGDELTVKPVRLVDPRFYHLDTCFCPLNEETGIWFPKAFDENSQKLIKGTIDMIPVAEKEAAQFACNSVVIGKHVIMHEGNEEIAKTLQKNGYQVHFVNMSEFIKSGGSTKCCTLQL